MIPCPGKPDPAEDLVLMELPAEAAVFYRKMVEDAAAEMEAAVKELGIPVAPPPPASGAFREVRGNYRMCRSCEEVH